MAIIEVPWSESMYVDETSGFGKSAAGTDVNSGFTKSYITASQPTSETSYPFPSAQTDFWFHCRINVVNTSGGSVPVIVLRGNSTELFRIVILNDEEHWKVEYWNGTAWTQVGTDITDRRYLFKSDNFNRNGIPSCDIHITMSDTVGVFDVYCEKTLMASLGGGDTIFTAETSIDSILFTSMGTAFSEVTVSDIVLADEDTREFNVKETTPNTVGVHTDFAGSISSIDDPIYAPNDFSFVSTNVTGAKQSYGIVLNRVFDNDFKCVEVFHIMRARDGGFNANRLNAMLHKGVTDYSGTPQTINTFFIDYLERFPTNPETATAWGNATELEGFEWGFQNVV